MTNNIIKTIYSSIFDTIETNKGFGNFDKFTINHKLKESKKIDDSIKLDPKFINNDNVNNKEKIKKTPIIIKKVYIEEENNEDCIEFPESASQYIPIKKPKMEKSIKIGNNQETMNKNKDKMLQTPIPPIPQNSNTKRNFINALLKKPQPKEVILNSKDSDNSKDYDTSEEEAIQNIENDSFNDIVADSQSLEYDAGYDKNKNNEEYDDLHPGEPMEHEKDFFKKINERDSKPKNLIDNENKRKGRDPTNDNDSDIEVSSSSDDNYSDSPSLNDKNINIEDLFANYKDNNNNKKEPIQIDLVNEDEDDNNKKNQKEEDDLIIIDKEKEEEEIDLFKIPEKKNNNLFNNFDELVEKIKDILDIKTHFIPSLEVHFGVNPIKETDDPNSKYLMGFLNNHINNLSAVFALLLRKTEINKILKNYNLIFINAPKIKYELIDEEKNNKKYYKKIEKSIEDRKIFIDQQINNLQQQYTKQRSKKKQDLDIIFNLINKHFGELISRTNYNFFIEKLIELSESVFDYNDFPLKSFIECSLEENLDFAPSILTRKFTEEDKKCFNSIPKCISSRKPFEIGEEVRVCRLIQIDKERSIDWHHGEKLPANPHKEEIFLKSLKCYYVKANDEIDLENDEKFELFKFDDNLKLPSNNIENKMDIDNNNIINNNNNDSNNKKKKTTSKKKLNVDKKKVNVDKKKVNEEKKKVKKTNKKKQDLNQITKLKKNNTKNTKGKKRKLNEIINEKIPDENNTKKQKLNNNKSLDIVNNNNSINEDDNNDDDSREYTISDLLKKNNNDDDNIFYEQNNQMVNNNNIYTEELHLNNLILKLKPIDSFLIKFNEKYYVKITPLWIEINNCLQYYLKDYKEGKRKLEIDLKSLKDGKSIFFKFHTYINNKKNVIKEFYHKVDDFTLGILEFFSLIFIENKSDILKSYNKEFISECKDKILYNQTGIAFNRKQILLDLIYLETKKVDSTSFCHFKPFMNENFQLLKSIDEILFFKYHKFVLLDLFYYFFYNRK